MLKFKLYLILILIISSFLLSGCSLTYFAAFGIKNTKNITEEKIAKLARKFNVPPENIYELDTSYVSFIFSHDTSQFAEEIKNHMQPLQALYFDKSENLQSFHVNCYAGGFPNLNWNWNGALNSFPPQSITPIDSLLSFRNQLIFLRPLKFTSDFSSEHYDYIVFVYWSRFMGRQSKILINSIQNNCKLAKDEKIKIIYVNNDNIFAEIDLVTN